MIFGQLGLMGRPKMGGTETLPSGTWIGTKDGEWVEANGLDIPAELLLIHAGRPGERCEAARSAVITDADGNLTPGSIVMLGNQRVGLVIDNQSTLMEACSVLPVPRVPLPGDVPEVQEPGAPGVNPKRKRGGGGG